MLVSVGTTVIRAKEVTYASRSRKNWLTIQALEVLQVFTDDFCRPRYVRAG